MITIGSGRRRREVAAAGPHSPPVTISRLFSNILANNGRWPSLFWIIAVAKQDKSRREGHPVLLSHSPVVQSNQESFTERQCDISGLLEMLASVTDPRNARGRQYLIGFILAVAVVAGDRGDEFGGGDGPAQLVAHVPEAFKGLLGLPPPHGPAGQRALV